MKYLLSTCLLWLFASSLLAQHATPLAAPESVGMSSERLKRVDQQMHEFVDNGQLAGVQTAIMRKGKLIHFDTYGLADLDSQQPLDDNSIWRIYSMTKSIVSVALMMLYEQGKFQLNDPLHRYIPAMKDLQVHKGEGRPSLPNSRSASLIFSVILADWVMAGGLILM